MSSFRDLVKKANVGKNTDTNKEEKRSSFKDLVTNVNNGTIKVTSTLNSSQVNDWYKGVRLIGQNAYNYLKAEGYKNPDTSYLDQIDTYLAQANDVGQYLRANKSSFSNYEEMLQNYNDTLSYLRDLKSGVKNSNSFYSRFENEDHYKVSSMDIGELKTQLDGISNAQGDMDLVDEINRSLVPFGGYGDNATPEDKRKHEDFINKVTTLWEKYGKDKYDTVEDFYYGEFYTGAGGNVYKAAEEKAKGVAYTTKSGQNITWQSLYDNAVAAEDLANRLDTYSKNSDWDELSKGKDVSSDPDRQSDYDLVWELSRSNVAYDKETALANGTSEAEWNDIDQKRRYIGNKYGVDLYDDIYANVNIFNEILTMLDDKSWGSGELSKQLGENVIGEQTFKNMRHLNDDEEAVLNYIFYSQGRDAALQWHNSRMNIYQDRANGVLTEEMFNVGKNSWGGLGAFVSPASLGSIVLSLGSGIEQIGDWVTGDNNNTLARASSAIRSGISENTDWMIGNFDAFDFAYNTTMSGADSLVASALPGGSVLLGLSAAAQASNDAVDRGLSQKQAFWNGLMAGTFECLFESWSIGKFKALKEVASAHGKDIALNIAKSMLVNASEETLTEIANIAYDLIANGDLSQYETLARQYVASGMSEAEAKRKAGVDLNWQVVESGASGAFMGLGFGAIGSAGPIVNNTVGTAVQDIKAGKSIIGADGGTKALENLAMEVFGADSRTTKQAKKVTGETATGKGLGKVTAAVKNISNQRAVGKLYRTISESTVSAQDKANIAKSLEESGFSPKSAKHIADALAAKLNGKQLTNFQQSTLDTVNGNEKVREIVNNLLTDVESPVGKRNKAMNEFESGVAISMMAKQYTDKAFTPEGKYAVSSDGEAKALVTEEVDGKSITKDTGDVINIKGIASIRKGKMLLDIGDGKTIDSKNVAYANKNDALIYEAIANLGDNIDADTANKLISKFDGGNAMVFARGIAQAYTYGFYGLDRSEMKGKHTLSAELTEAQRNYAYGLGEKYRPVKDQADKANAKVAKAPGEKGVYYRDKDGKATDIRTYLKETEIGLKDVQKTAIEVMEKMSEMLGVRFNVFESWVENGKRYYLDENGVKTQGSPNGFYDTATGEIYIDLNAGNDYQGTMLFTVAHELTHFMRQWSPEQFTKIAKLVFQHGGMKGSVAKLAAIKQAKAKAKGKPISYDTAVEEVVADGMETILKDGKVLEFMEDVKKTDHEAWAKLKEWFQKLADFLKELVDAYRGHSAQTVEGAKVADFAEDLLTQIKQIWAEGAVDAGQTYQMAVGNVKVSNDITMEEDVIDSSNNGISKEAKTGVKMQERTEFEAQPKQVFRVSTANGKAESNMLGTNKSVKELRDANFKENGFSKEEVDKINGFIKEMADNMTKYRLKYKFIGLQNIHDAKIILNPMTGKIVLSAMVNNSDYSVNFDFTKICKKRVALQEVLESLAKEKGKVTDGKVTEVNLSPANIKHINDILASYGVETACLCCFVESKRYNIQNYYQEKVVDVWNMLVDEVAPDAAYFNFADSDVDTSKIPDSEFADLEMQMKEWAGKTGKAKDVEQKMREFLADSPAARKKLRFSDLVTANGRTNLHKLYPEIESLILSKLGQSAPKSVEAFTPYNGEIDLLEATNNGDIVKYLYSIAGVRSQSFSDFMIAHVFDVLQKTASMSARKMPAHVYTKEIARAMLFGMTGEKHNMSVLHNVDPDVDSWSAGLSKDGEYNFSDYEAYKKGYSEFVQSIGWKDAVTLQNTEGYSKDCGIIGVGFSYNHMLKLHNDPEVRQVIGYHTSQMPVEVKPLTHLDKAADYTGVQNTKAFVGFAKPNYAIPEGVPSYATPPQDVTYKGSKTKKVADTFDIVGTFNKLSEGKTGDARTAAAKETLRQLLEYANDHGYVITTASGEAGKGEFDLYGDVQKTQNPYLTTDHYIEYCIERGMLPMFFEFSMNPNYYKDIFDFNVFDRKSYNPETGLHEDSDGRKAYAPQTAVHMLNEDGSLAFPENFFDIVDKQMNSYNRYMQDVDSKMPSIMDEVRAVTNSTSKMSDRDFTYKELTAKNPLKGRVIDKNRTVKLTSDGSIDRAWVVSEVLKQCESIQTKAPAPTYFVNVPDIGKNVEIVGDAIRHGFIKYQPKNGKPVPPKSLLNARVSLDLPQILRNSIEVNRSDRGDNAQVEFSHVLIGVTALESANGTIEYCVVRSVVEARKNQGAILTEANVIGKLHAMNAKKIGKPRVQAGTNSTNALAGSSLFSYSVADLLNDVKNEFNDTFSNDVYKHFGMTRKISKFSPFLKFSDRDSDGFQLSKAQQEFFKDSVVRDADGNLMVMYHGTANGGAFTVFDGDQLDNSSLKSQIGQGFYFTNVKKEAEAYMQNVDIYGKVSKGKNPNLHHVYLNITNPFDINADELDLEKVKAVYMDGTSDHFFDSFIAHYLYNKTVNGRVFTRTEVQAMSKADRVSIYVDYLAQIGTKELLSNMVQAFSYGKQSALLTSMQNRLGYDGIVEEYAPGKFQYVAFSSEQVKYTDNQNPTSDPDIRYSDRDSDGNQLSEAQQEFFKDSKVRDEYGRLVRVFHGTERGGFTVFSNPYPNSPYFHDAYWFSDSDTAKSYADFSQADDSTMLYEVYLNAKNPLIIDADGYRAVNIPTDIFDSDGGRKRMHHIDDIAMYAKDNGYDGLIVKNVKDYGVYIEESLGVDSDYDLGTGTVYAVFKPEQVKSVDNQNPTADPDIRFQDRDDDSVSNRSLLANAFEGLAQNDIERNKIKEYKEKITLINEEERKLRELNAQIKELSFSEGPRDTKKIKGLRFDAAQAANRINTYDKQLLRLEASKPLQDVLNREKRRAYKKAEERGKEALADYKAKVEAKQKETTEKWRESRKTAVAKARETAEKRDARAKLQKLVLDTVKWLSYPAKTDVKCPDILKKPYEAFLQGIDLSSKRLANGGEATKNDLRLANAMGSLATALDKIMISQDPTQEVDKVLDTGYLDLPADFVQKLRDMTENIKAMMVEGDYVVNNMTAAEVRQISQMIRTLNHAIKTMSNLYANLRFANVEALGFDTMEFMDALGEIEKTGGMKDFVQWDNALPYYAFKRFGKGGESVFEGLMDAQDKLAFLAQAIFDFQEKSWTGEEAKAWSEDSHTITLPNGNELTLTTADAMSIYCLSRREQGLQHLLGGGTRVLGIQKGSKKAKDSRSLLTLEDISAINSSLTDRQKQVAEAIQEFMSTVCSEWGNEISMKRFLTKEFTEKFYFPIESNDENLPVKDPAAQQSDLFRLLNISATKPLTPGANNEVIIRNIFDVFTGHASDMARLNAYGMSLLDYMKWLNYREKATTEEGQVKVRGVRKSMQQAYGDAAMSYVLNLVKDVNGRASDGGDPNILMKWMRSAKTASVGNSLRVATLQITSYPRAALVLSPKSLALGLTKMPQIEKAKKYCGIALWKSFGFYDTNISRSIEDQMKGVTDIKQKLIELSLKGAEWGDAITWGALWNACEYEVAQTTKNKVGSEEFYQEVGKKLREVVYRTQVVDSTLTRSQIMRSKRGMAQEAAAFMSEPTLSANILMDAGFEFNAEKRRTGSVKAAWNKTGKYIGRAVAVYAIGQLTAALLEGLWDAWRDEEDEEFGKKYLDAFIENLALDLVPFNKIPIVSDVFEAVLAMFDVGFYSSDKMSTTWLTQAVSAVDTWKDALSDESSVTVYNALYKTTRAISSFFGVSISGVMREAVALWNNTAGAYDATLKILTYGRSKEELGGLLLDAIVEGNDRQAESLKAEFEDEAEYASALRKAIKSRYEAGEIDADTAEQYLVDYCGMEKDDAYWKVGEWEYETETGEDFQKYNNFYTAVQTGKNLKAVIKEYTDNGVDSKTLASKITSNFKPLYKEMSKAERAAIKGYLLNAYELLGYDRAKKSKDIDKWVED